MLKLERIMEIAAEHARHCCGPGETAGEHHNIQVLSVAIQEALSENDEKAQALLRARNGRATLSTNGKPSRADRGRQTRTPSE